MNVFTIIIVAALIATFSVVDAAVGQNALSSKGFTKRTLKEGKSKKKKSTPKKLSCPASDIYKAPIGCDALCYRDVDIMVNDINSKVAGGEVFVGTICHGTFPLSKDKRVISETSGADVTILCCGSAGSCIVDGENETRDLSVFNFRSTVKQFRLEGVAFKNIKCIGDDCDGALLFTKAVSVVAIRYISVESAQTDQSGGVFSFGYDGTDASSDVTIQNSSFANCQSTVNFGGVIAGYRSHMELIGNTFNGNYAGNSGGAIDYINDCTVVATCNTFSNNKAETNNGGAVAAYNSFSHFIYNTFDGNSAIRGGAVRVKYETFLSEGNTYANNRAIENGGATYGAYALINVVSDTFIGNEALVTARNVYLVEALLKICRSPTLDGVAADEDSIVMQEKCD